MTKGRFRKAGTSPTGGWFHVKRGHMDRATPAWERRRRGERGLRRELEYNLRCAAPPWGRALCGPPLEPR